MSARDFPVWARGAVQPAFTPVVAAEDQGFLLGLAVFETLLVESGHAYFEREHLERLRLGARVLDIDPAAVDPSAALAELIDAIDADPTLAQPREYAVRIVLSRGVPGSGPTLVVTARERIAPPAEGAVVLVSSFRIHSDALAGVKATSRLRNVAARAEAERYGAWEALLLNADGDLAEGTISNLFVARDGRLVTPGTDAGCLGGIMRELIVGDGSGPVAVDVERCRITPASSRACSNHSPRPTSRWI